MREYVGSERTADADEGRLIRKGLGINYLVPIVEDPQGWQESWRLAPGTRRSAKGKYAHVPYSSEDLIRDKRAEVELEDR